jgi:hypothetical protein
MTKIWYSYDSEEEYHLKTPEDRLAKLFAEGGINFSVETVNSKTGPKVLITIIRKTKDTQQIVGGSYESVDEGMTDCLDRIEEIIKNKRKLKLVK